MVAAVSDAPFAGRELHFVGIGGAGMSGLALVARALGARVTGSDRADSPYCEPLRAAGIEPLIGHDAANVPPDAEVVVSTAIGDDNPELAAARERGQAVLHRGDLLGEVSRLKRTVAVSGTHGKTTTASMAAHALRECGRDPGFLIGGELRSAGSNAGWGAGEWAVDRGRRIRPLVPEARPRRRGRHEHGARPPRHLPLARRADGGLRRVRPPRRAARARSRRGAARGRRAADLRDRGRRSAGGGRGADAAGLALPGGRGGGRAGRARAPQRPERAGSPGRLPRGGPGARRGRRGAGGLHRRGPAFRGPRRGPGGFPRLRRLRPPPDRGAGHARGRAHARAGPRDRRVPAAPVLAHEPPGAGVRACARPRRRRGGAWRSIPRASAPRTTRA